MLLFDNKSFLESSISSETLEKHLDKLYSRDDLGFLRLNASSVTAYIEEKCQHLKNFDNIVIIGMGGSSLGAQCLVESLSSIKHRFHFWNSSDPDTLINSLQKIADISRTHFIVISKSGGTLESLIMTNFAADTLLKSSLDLAVHMTVITENRPSPLFSFASEHKIKMLPHPQDVGGRFSVFTIVGLLPAYLSGLNIKQILLGAEKAITNKKQVLDLSSSLLSTIARQDETITFWPYTDCLSFFSEWLQQLWAESLGKKENLSGQKNKKIPTPFFCIGTKNQHSILQLFVDQPTAKSFIFLQLKNKKHDDIKSKNYFNDLKYLENLSLYKIFDSQASATQESLTQNNAHTMKITLDEITEEQMGYLLMLFQISIATIGEYLNINAFDQPAVEHGKKIVMKMLTKI